MTRHRDFGAARKYSDAQVRRMEELSVQHGRQRAADMLGMPRTVLDRQINEYGMGGSAVYRPKVLKEEHRWNFAEENV